MSFMIYHLLKILNNVHVITFHEIKSGITIYLIYKLQIVLVILFLQ